MDFLFGGDGGGQGSSLAGAAAAASASAGQVNSAPAASSASGVSEAIASSTSSASSHASRVASAATHAALHQLAQTNHFNDHDNGPILYTDSNRTSAIDDIRSVVIYIFIITVLVCFLLILPGIRHEKLPTFFCISTSLLVSSIIIVSLFGTTWQVGEAPISAAYKAFSRDRIQGDLAVHIGLQSVNISLKAHKYYILHATDGPMIMENVPAVHMLAGAEHRHQEQTSSATETPADDQPASQEGQGSQFVLGASPSRAGADRQPQAFREPTSGRNQRLADELLVGRTADGIPVDTELESQEVFSFGADVMSRQQPRRAPRSSPGSSPSETQFSNRTSTSPEASSNIRSKSSPFQKYTIKRAHVDINYNERFYWIGPMQMRHEFHQALERGLPFPILTVVEYLSQDDAGFNWSRRYRAAGYYTSMCLWLSASVCALMFCLHCAAPKYGIYAMQALGALLLFTNFIYATLVPKGAQELVIPFEGQSLAFRFGWNFWLVLVGGCLSLLVGTIIVIIDKVFPNYIFTTVLDVDFDSPHQNYYQRKHKILGRPVSEGDGHESGDDQSSAAGVVVYNEKPKLPPFMRESKLKKRTATSRSTSTASPSTMITGGQDSMRPGVNYNDDSNLIQQQNKHVGPTPGPDSSKHLRADRNRREHRTTSDNRRLSSDESLRMKQQTVEQQRRSSDAGETSSVDKRDIESRERLEDADNLRTIRL